MPTTTAFLVPWKSNQGKLQSFNLFRTSTHVYLYSKGGVFVMKLSQHQRKPSCYVLITRNNNNGFPGKRQKIHSTSTYRNGFLLCTSYFFVPHIHVFCATSNFGDSFSWNSQNLVKASDIAKPFVSLSFCYPFRKFMKKCVPGFLGRARSHARVVVVVENPPPPPGWLPPPPGWHYHVMDGGALGLYAEEAYL